MPRTLAELAREVLIVQDACNIGGVSRAFAQAMVDLGPHCPDGTEQKNTHAITICWIDKMASMARISSFNFDADENRRIAAAFEEVRRLADTAPPEVLEVHECVWEEQPGEPPFDACSSCGKVRF